MKYALVKKQKLGNFKMYTHSLFLLGNKQLHFFVTSVVTQQQVCIGMDPRCDFSNKNLNTIMFQTKQLMSCETQLSVIGCT